MLWGHLEAPLSAAALLGRPATCRAEALWKGAGLGGKGLAASLRPERSAVPSAACPAHAGPCGRAPRRCARQCCPPGQSTQRRRRSKPRRWPSTQSTGQRSRQAGSRGRRQPAARVQRVGGPVPRPEPAVPSFPSSRQYIGGAFTSYMPPGVWTTFGAALTEPVCNIHWCAARSVAFAAAGSGGPARWRRDARGAPTHPRCCLPCLPPCSALQGRYREQPALAWVGGWYGVAAWQAIMEAAPLQPLGGTPQPQQAPLCIASPHTSPNLQFLRRSYLHWRRGCQDCFSTPAG